MMICLLIYTLNALHLSILFIIGVPLIYLYHKKMLFIDIFFY